MYKILKTPFKIPHFIRSFEQKSFGQLTPAARGLDDFEVQIGWRELAFLTYRLSYSIEIPLAMSRREFDSRRSTYTPSYTPYTPSYLSSRTSYRPTGRYDSFSTTPSYYQPRSTPSFRTRRDYSYLDDPIFSNRYSLPLRSYLATTGSGITRSNPVSNSLYYYPIKKASTESSKPLSNALSETHAVRIGARPV